MLRGAPERNMVTLADLTVWGGGQGRTRALGRGGSRVCLGVESGVTGSQWVRFGAVVRALRRCQEQSSSLTALQGFGRYGWRLFESIQVDCPGMVLTCKSLSIILVSSLYQISKPSYYIVLMALKRAPECLLSAEL
jgi:hypothetical protein